MKIWSVQPKYLDTKGLDVLWGEHYSPNTFSKRKRKVIAIILSLKDLNRPKIQLTALINTWLLFIRKSYPETIIFTEKKLIEIFKQFL